MLKATVKETNISGRKVYRVMDGRVPAGEAKRPADGGGFEDRAKAEGLCAQINLRRARKIVEEAAAGPLPAAE